MGHPRNLRCIRCNKTSLDLRYFWNGTTYELEYHCSTLEGGCNFYRILPFNYSEGEEE